MFLSSTFPRECRKSDVDSDGGNKATYSGMEIEKAIDSDFEGVVLDSDNYEGGINQIGITHERTKRRNVALTEEEQDISWSELGKLMWVARIARPGAIYDTSAAAQTFPDGETIDSNE